MRKENSWSTEKELQTIKIAKLLQDKDFVEEIILCEFWAYYRGQNEIPPELDIKPITKEVQENIAINLAWFYALECWIWALLDMNKYKNDNPIWILNKIVKRELKENDMLLIARFANATRKAGQPFRSLDRITRPNFIPAIQLSHEELKKDFDQIFAAAEKILEKMLEDEK